MPTIDYEQDFVAWLEDQAQKLRSGQLTDLDTENIAEELESMGRSDKRALNNRLETLLAHLLKWQIQTEHRTASWKSTIAEQRNRIEDLLEDSPSLVPSLQDRVTKVYGRARNKALLQTGLIDPDQIPATCPFSLDEIMNGII